MTSSYLSAGQLTFVIVVPLVVLLIIGLAIFIPLYNKRAKENFVYHYYRKIYRIAMDNDYYLINNFLFKIDNSHIGKIDHILFGDKYIYIISDSYFDGNVDGKETDTSIIVVTKEGKKYYEDNPLLANKKLIEKLCLITGIDQSLMIGVCLINDTCRCAVQTTTKNSYIVQRMHLKQLVRAIESRNIGDINKEQLASAVKAIDKLNRRNRKGGRK